MPVAVAGLAFVIRIVIIQNLHATASAPHSSLFATSFRQSQHSSFKIFDFDFFGHSVSPSFFTWFSNVAMSALCSRHHTRSLCF